MVRWIYLTKSNGRIWQMVLAFLGTYGFFYMLGLAGIEQACFSGLGLPVMIAVYMLVDRTRENLSKLADAKQRRRRIRYAAIVSYALSLTMIMGYQLQNIGLLDYGVKGKSLILLRALFLSITVFPFGNMLLHGLEKVVAVNIAKGKGKLWKNGAVLGICAAVIFVCLIPVWLA